METLLSAALAARADLIDAEHEHAFRLFSGFYEGFTDLVVDVYGRTLVLHNYADAPENGLAAVQMAQAYLSAQLPWIQTVVVKHRNAPEHVERRGVVTVGDRPDRHIREHGVRYAIDLFINRDAGFYLDTRFLRAWVIDQLAGETVLNAFAYTGSLGVAALAGGARRVVQLDQNRAFLNVARTSYALNSFAVNRADFIAGDFWEVTSRMRRRGASFDCVILDPPFFATSKAGRVDLANEGHRLVNKVRPLVSDGGRLVVINNALFVSGADFMRSLEALCADGYLSIETQIPVPPDITGYPNTRVGAPPVDPAPFNHSTKIAVLRVRRKTISSPDSSET